VAVDWEAAETIAERLGIHTRALVAGRDAEAVEGWALSQACAHGVSETNVPRAASYFELAVLVGHVPAEAADGGD
jgi:hypothetical protein